MLLWGSSYLDLIIRYYCFFSFQFGRIDLDLTRKSGSKTVNFFVRNVSMFANLVWAKEVLLFVLIDFCTSRLINLSILKKKRIEHGLYVELDKKNAYFIFFVIGYYHMIYHSFPSKIFMLSTNNNSRC